MTAAERQLQELKQESARESGGLDSARCPECDVPSTEHDPDGNWHCENPNCGVSW